MEVIEVYRLYISDSKIIPLVPGFEGAWYYSTLEEAERAKREKISSNIPRAPRTGEYGDPGSAIDGYVFQYIDKVHLLKIGDKYFELPKIISTKRLQLDV